MGHLCLWFVRTRLEFVKVGQLFPVVVLVLIRVVMVRTHDVISRTGVRLLWPRDSEEQESPVSYRQTEMNERRSKFTVLQDSASERSETVSCCILYDMKQILL